MPSSKPSTLSLNAIRQKIAGHAAQTDTAAQFPAQSVDVLRQSGLLGLLVPTKFGGMEASAVTFADAAMQIGSACASTGMIFVMHSCAIECMAKHWNHADETLRLAAQGKHVSTLACSERGSGANFYASLSKSSSNDKGFVLNADKCFVTSGGHANSYIVATQAVESDDVINTSLYVVDAGDPGISFEGRWNGLGMRGNNSIALKAKDARIPHNRLVGDQGQGFAIEMGTILPRFLLGSASVYTGIAQAALDATVAHLKQRIHAHTGEALTTLAVVRRKVAEMKVAVDACTVFNLAAAQAFDDAHPDLLIKLLEAKRLACRTAVEVTTMAMECCGGIAYGGGLSVDRHFRDAQAGVVMAPTDDILLELIGRAALGLELM